MAQVVETRRAAISAVEDSAAVFRHHVEDSPAVALGGNVRRDTWNVGTEARRFEWYTAFATGAVEPSGMRAYMGRVAQQVVPQKFRDLSRTKVSTAGAKDGGIIPVGIVHIDFPDVYVTVHIYTNLEEAAFAIRRKD